MIGTIGFLVQDATNRWRWLIAASLYCAACTSTAALLGATLGAVGHTLRGASVGTPFPAGAWIVGLLAIAYALSDVGFIPLPRPTVMYAVPITWWRRWGPYTAALAYGSALGFGITTRIAFGAFYMLCAWCALTGDVVYGALLLGTYGAARGLVIFPASWGVYCHRASPQAWLSSPLFDIEHAQRLVAGVLIMFGGLTIASSFF